MNIQLALDRMSIEEAVDMARRTEPFIDWIEVGTSLIKEFGMASVEVLKREFPHKIIVADMKTFDNAKYEFELCFKAGADVATVMGAAPPVTVALCMETARRMERQVMIDLLHTSPERRRELARHSGAVHCLHISKDQQEGGGLRLEGAASSGAGHGSAAGPPGAAAYAPGARAVSSGATELAHGVPAMSPSAAACAHGGANDAHDAPAGASGAPGGQDASRADMGGNPGPCGPGGLRLAAAGGITLESLPGLLPLKPEVVIIGAAITKAPDPAKAAREFKERIEAFSKQR